jgi:hypothetical protein
VKDEKHAAFWVGSLQARDHLEDPLVDGKIILKWLSGNSVGCGSDSFV